MPTTSNFGWTTPADTDLVKDGAAAIRTLGNGVDASLVDLKGGTTGQVLSKATNADLDYTWITPNVGDITEVQAGVGISIASGTGPIPIITNSSTDLITTAGDILYGTAADTVARLGIGTAGQVLKVNSGATAPEWGAAGGGWTQIGSTITLNGASNYTINTTTGYRNWVIELDDPYGASGDINPYIFFNGDTTVANYRGCVVRSIPAGFQSAVIDTATVFYFALEPTSGNDNYCQIQVFDPDASTHRKGYNCNSVINSSTGTQVSTVMFQWENAAAITSVRVQTDTGVNFAGGTFKIWGLK